MQELSEKSQLQTMLQSAIDQPRRLRLIQLTRALLALPDDDTPTRVDNDQIDEYNRGVQTTLNATGGVWSHYEPYRPSVREFSRINYIQNNLRILTAQTRTVDVCPQWVNTPTDSIEEARSAWWQWRSQGMDGLGGWKLDLDNAFSDFAGLGEGYLRCGVIDGAKGDACTVTHYHPLNVLLDPYAKYPGESRWVCFSTIMSKEESECRFPKFDYDEYTTQHYKRYGIQLEGVRIVEYFGRKNLNSNWKGFTAFAGGIDGQIIEEGDNPFGDMLPYQAFVGFIPSGTDQPIGMVAACLYIQRELDRMDDDARKKSMRDNLLGLLPSLFNKDDLKSYADGNRPEFLRLDEQAFNKIPDVSKALFSVPRNGENADQKERRQELFGVMQQLSGVTSLDMGQVSNTDTTATEVNQAASRSQAQVSYYSLEFARGMQDLASKVGAIAKKYDTDPFCVNSDGIPIWFNSDDKRLTSKAIFDGPLNCVIGSEDLLMTDVNNKRARDGAKWLQILQISQAPEAWKRYLLSQGIKNPEDYPLPAPQGPQGQPQPGGMPMPQPQPAMGAPS